MSDGLQLRGAGVIRVTERGRVWPGWSVVNVNLGGGVCGWVGWILTISVRTQAGNGMSKKNLT
jgi:hypothetical protein